MCGEIIKENKNREGVMKLRRLSHKCPKCDGTLYIDDTGAPIDLGAMIVKAMELSVGVVLPKEEALAHYIEV